MKELSHSLLKLAECGGSASYSPFTAARGYRHSGPPPARRSILSRLWPRVFVDVDHEDSRGALRGRDGAERGHERAQFAMVLDASEALGGAQQAEPDPPPSHVAIAPALDVPRDMPQRADQILDAVRRREEAAQRRWQPQLQHGERFLQAFAHTGRGIGRSEEHTSELQSRLHLVCRLLLEKKKNDD